MKENRSIIKKAIFLVIIAIPIAVLVSSLLGQLSKVGKHMTEEESVAYGELGMNETEIIDIEKYDDEPHDDSDHWDDSWEEGIDIPEDNIDCYYTNMEVVFHYIPVGVVNTLRMETSEFLNQNGYDDDTAITILEDTIIGDRSDVTFSCSMTTYPDDTLYINYVPRRGTVEFTIK